jgi:hypothetical protein
MSKCLAKKKNHQFASGSSSDLTVFFSLPFCRLPMKQAIADLQPFAFN